MSSTAVDYFISDWFTADTTATVENHSSEGADVPVDSSELDMGNYDCDFEARGFWQDAAREALAVAMAADP